MGEEYSVAKTHAALDREAVQSTYGADLTSQHESNVAVKESVTTSSICSR
jgi:hypothetical protein